MDQQTRGVSNCMLHLCAERFSCRALPAVVDHQIQFHQIAFALYHLELANGDIVLQQMRKELAGQAGDRRP